MGLYYLKRLSEPAPVFFTVRFTLSRSSPAVRNATHLRTFCFLEVKLFLPLDRFLSTSVSFCSSIYIEDSPKLPWGMHRICGPFVLKTIIMNYFAFQETLMSCATRSLDLLILFKLMFLYPWYIPPHSCAFHTFCLHQFFSYVYYHAEYISFLWWCRWSEKARNLILILNFSSRKPHLIYILLSNVCSFEFP